MFCGKQQLLRIVDCDLTEEIPRLFNYYPIGIPPPPPAPAAAVVFREQCGAT